jgi:hypothetical protein
MYREQYCQGQRTNVSTRLIDQYFFICRSSAITAILKSSGWPG